MWGAVLVRTVKGNSSDPAPVAYLCDWIFVEREELVVGILFKIFSLVCFSFVLLFD